MSNDIWAGKLATLPQLVLPKTKSHAAQHRAMLEAGQARWTGPDAVARTFLDDENAAARVEEVYQAALAEHQEQRTGFAFGCSRFGDFLNFWMIRVQDGRPQKIAQTWPLHNVRIVLTEGHPPAREGGPFRYEWEQSTSTREDVVEVRPVRVTAPHRRFLAVDPDGGAVAYASGRRRLIATRAFPVFAVDDEISFSGQGALCVPAGLGIGVLKQIHEALATFDACPPKVELPC